MQTMSNKNVLFPTIIGLMGRKQDFSYLDIKKISFSAKDSKMSDYNLQSLFNFLLEENVCSDTKKSHIAQLYLDT